MSRPAHKPDTQGVINRDVNAAQRAVEAVKLRAKKLTYDDIAKQCGYANPGACRKAVLREMNRVVVTNVEELRREQLYELDQLQAEIWGLATDKGYKGRLFAVDRLLAIMKRRAELMGLDQSTGTAIAAAQVIIREVPGGYLTGPQV
jgi:hypothetical protein